MSSHHFGSKNRTSMVRASKYDKQFKKIFNEFNWLNNCTKLE